MSRYLVGIWKASRLNGGASWVPSTTNSRTVVTLDSSARSKAGTISSTFSMRSPLAPRAFAAGTKLTGLGMSTPMKRLLKKSTWFFFSAHHAPFLNTQAMTGSLCSMAELISCRLMPQAPSPMMHTTGSSGLASFAPSPAGYAKPVLPKVRAAMCLRGWVKRK